MKFNLKKLLAKEISDLSTEEKDFLRENAESMSDEQKTKFASVLEDEAMTEDELKKMVTKSVEEALNDEGLSKKFDTMADALVAKFLSGVSVARAKAQAGEVTVTDEEVDGSETTTKFFKALLNKESAEAKRVSNEAWEKALTSKDKDVRKLARARKKAMSTSTSGESPDDAQAGYLIPPELMAEVLRVPEDQYGIARREFRYLPFSGPGNSRTIPALGTSVQVYWTDEGERKQSTQAKFNLITQTLKKLAAIVPMTEEIIEDSAINLNSLLAELFNEATAKEEDIQFFNGTGSPFTGIINNAQVAEVLQASGDVNQLTADDLLDLKMAVPTSMRSTGHYQLHPTILAVIRKLKGSDGQYIWQSPRDGQPGTIWGSRYVENDAMPSLSEVTTGDPYVLFGDLKKCAIYGDKQQLRVKLLTEATVTDTDGETVLNLAEQDMVALRIVKRVGYVLGLPAGLAVLKAQATET